MLIQWHKMIRSKMPKKGRVRLAEIKQSTTFHAMHTSETKSWNSYAVLTKTKLTEMKWVKTMEFTIAFNGARVSLWEFCLSKDWVRIRVQGRAEEHNQRGILPQGFCQGIVLSATTLQRVQYVPPCPFCLALPFPPHCSWASTVVDCAGKEESLNFHVLREWNDDRPITDV